MANKAVFVDRDRTLIEDTGYLSDPSAVKLLPGVELAVKSLARAGYRIVVVTNQSGIARGMLTEETLEKIHAEMRRQLSEKGARVDAIYYCPYHPEGTVEEYARDSELRKPQPGMLLKAARELDIDLSQSWMVGDSARDIEAGQRAGVGTIRVRVRATTPPGEDGDENVQADFTVRNLVDAARIILRGAGPDAHVPSGLAHAVEQGLQPQAKRVEQNAMSDADVQRELLRHMRKLTRADEAFRVTRLVAGIAQSLTILALGVVSAHLYKGNAEAATVWALIAVAMQVMALTFYIMGRQRTG